MIYQGDSLDVLKTLEPNSIDAVVTDPPYGWRFMGKAWDAPDIQSVFTRDKTLPTDDKTTLGMAAGKYDQSLTANQSFQEWTEAWAKEAFRVLKPGGHALIFCGPRTYHRMASGVEDAGFEIRDQLQWLFGSGFPKSHNLGDGWGTALKPANEPIVLARKPLSEKTVALNVAKWGTGGLKIDASRIEGIPPVVPQPAFNTTGEIYNMKTGEGRSGQMSNSTQGRWPTNLLLDEEAAEMLDEQSGTLKSGKLSPHHVIKERENNSKGFEYQRDRDQEFGGDTGGASRFFYCAKASKRERGKENNHPTVKPIKLMEYLIRLITPLGGIVLDPFMGSGTTGVACKQLGFEFIGIELNEEYIEIAKRRISA